MWLVKNEKIEENKHLFFDTTNKDGYAVCYDASGNFLISKHSCESNSKEETTKMYLKELKRKSIVLTDILAETLKMISELE